MYDCANSSFATTILAAIFPPFYRSLAIHAGLGEATATAAWGYTTSVALVIVAALSPVLGAIADHTGGKKAFTAVFLAIGVLCTAGFVLIGTDTWVLASILFVGGNLGFSGSIIFYESLLPHIARPNDVDRVSTRGYALGYVGGGLLLVLNMLWVMHPRWFAMPDQAFALRASFTSVAVWWSVFSVPFFRHVPEPPVARAAGVRRNPLGEGFSRLGATFREIRRYHQLVWFLLAFWCYNDGIGTIIKMATAYGDEIGIGLGSMVLALVITQAIGVPCTFAFGPLARRVGAKGAVLLGLAVYTLISVGGYFMTSAVHFYILAVLVGAVQGGTQALSRSLFTSMVPKAKSAEFFGFFSTSEKMAGIVGPLVFGLISQWAGHSRLGIVSVTAFFVIGAILLAKVDVEEGARVAKGNIERSRLDETE